MSAHTPGPWTLHRSINAEHLRVVDSEGNPITNRIAADARLIAAAPEMLEALTALLALAEKKLDPERKHLFGGELVRARAAIAKATGGGK